LPSSTSPSPPISSQQSSIAQHSIAVLTPYSRQADLLKTILSGFKGLEVSSIDGFQGRESDIVIFNTVRCNAHHEIGFLKDLRRMNVALTRARAAVIVIGDRDTLTKGMADLESTRVWNSLLGRLVGMELGMADIVKDTGGTNATENGKRPMGRQMGTRTRTLPRNANS
jgi:regulator of nonsense transcripts 1